MKKIRKVDDQRFPRAYCDWRLPDATHEYEHKKVYSTTPVEVFFYALVAFAFIWVIVEIVG